MIRTRMVIHRGSCSGYGPIRVRGNGMNKARGLEDICVRLIGGTSDMREGTPAGKKEGKQEGGVRLEKVGWVKRVWMVGTVTREKYLSARHPWP